MICSACGFDNSGEQGFCGKCGSALARTCPGCGATNPAEFSFCGKCGTRLDSPEPAELSALREGVSTVAEAERRQITVLFCDLVGSTELSERLDPEELRDIMRAYQQAAAQEVERLGGHVAQYLGDGLLAYFGYPQAHEDDAQRAAHAGLGVVQEVAGLELPEGIHLSARVGIHTGQVVAGLVGGGSTSERLALGSTPNIAARLQGLADPDTVVVSEATAQLLGGLFEQRSLGAQSLKGVSAPVEVFTIVATKRPASRFETAVARGLTPLVGREKETGLLLGGLDRIAAVGQVILLEGEAGLGKSRLIHHVQRVSGERGYAWWQCNCSPFHQDSALKPLVDHLVGLIGTSHEEAADRRVEALAAFARSYGLESEAAIPLLTDLLAFPADERYPPLGLAPQLQRQRTLEMLLEVFRRECEKGPLVFVVEDLHWADPSTLDFLEMLVRGAAGMRIMALLTFRPAFESPWSADGGATPITVERLGDEQVGRIARHVAGGKELPEEILREIAGKTDGVPLYVEELTKMVLELGLLREEPGRWVLDGPLPPLAIPATLQDSLMARLDRLSAAKEVAQLGAVLGREFDFETLAAVSSLDEAALRRELDVLVEAEILFQAAAAGRAGYLFKHALIQDAAYGSLLRSTRQRCHAEIAAVYEERFPDQAALQPEVLAHHFTGAGVPAKAIEYWLKAGQRASAASASTEAVAHLRRGLSVLEELPASTERDALELQLQASLAPVLMTIKGYAAPEVERAYERAHGLCADMGDTPELFWVVWGLWAYYFVRGDLGMAMKMAERCAGIAAAKREPTLLILAYEVKGVTSYFLGAYRFAAETLERAVVLLEAHELQLPPFLLPHHPRVIILSYLGASQLFLGLPRAAHRLSAEAVEAARAVPHVLNRCFAHYFRAVVCGLRGEIEDAESQSRESIRIAREKGYLFFEACSGVIRGWSRVESGDPEGLEEIEGALATYLMTGAETSNTQFQAVLGESLLRLGRDEEALAAIERGLEIVARRGERHFEPELWRLRGEALLRLRGEPAEAEASLVRARRAARSLGSVLLELRAAIALARLRIGAGRAEEGREVLATALAGLSEEGADLPEAATARELLV